jgi:FkbM family methyltransferase
VRFFKPRTMRKDAEKVSDPELENSGVKTFSMPPYTSVTTQDDILACFRLLLGRNPNPEEWDGHMAHVGDSLPEVVASYTRSLEFARRGLNTQNTGEIVLTDFHDFKIYSDNNDGAVGKFIRQGVYEPDVTSVFRRILKPGMGILDIGANIGYFSFLSAAVVGESGRVFAIEPNQENAKLFEASRRLNGFKQISLLPVAAGPENGSLALYSSHSTGTTSSLPADLDALLSARLVPCLKLDDVLSKSDVIDLIKIDVDGAEYMALMGCEQLIQRHKPSIISEFAPDLLPGISGVSGEDYLSWFVDRKYSLAIIQPDGSLDEAGSNLSKVMDAYRQRGVDHIDILASNI